MQAWQTSGTFHHETGAEKIPTMKVSTCSATRYRVTPLTQLTQSAGGLGAESAKGKTPDRRQIMHASMANIRDDSSRNGKQKRSQPRRRKTENKTLREQ